MVRVAVVICPVGAGRGRRRCVVGDPELRRAVQVRAGGLLGLDVEGVLAGARRPPAQFTAQVNSPERPASTSPPATLYRTFLTSPRCRTR